jgi:hypothetical protein
MVNGHVLFDALAGIDVPSQRRRVGYVFEGCAVPAAPILGGRARRSAAGAVLAAAGAAYAGERDRTG